ncbi:MAG: cache domain-containing protein [Peptococcaceae bacterium]|nr:cache domain-containing protein [Peptococcaceae bacterium]
MSKKILAFKSMQGRLTALVAGIVIAAVLLVGYTGMRQLNRFGEANTEKIRAQMVEERQGKMESLVETTIALLDEYVRRAEGGEFSMEEARQRASRRIGSMRYDDGKGYFWIHSAGERPLMVMHPIKPEMNGQDLTGEEDFSIIQSLFYGGQVYPKSSDTISKNVRPTRLFVEMNRI